MLDTGQPPDKYRTGGIVWEGQQLAMRFKPRFTAPAPMNRTVRAITLSLDTRRLQGGTEQGARVLLALCEDPDGEQTGPLDRCVDDAEHFDLPARPSLQIEWRPQRPLEFSEGRLYWLVLAGDAKSEQTSITWLDGAVGAPATTNPLNRGASLTMPTRVFIKFTVVNHACSGLRSRRGAKQVHIETAQTVRGSKTRPLRRMTPCRRRSSSHRDIITLHPLNTGESSSRSL